MDPDRADVTEAEHRFLVLATGAEQPGAAEGERREGRLEQDPGRLPLVDVVALHHALPAAHLLLVAGADPAGGVDVEVAADLAAAKPGAQQQLGRAEGAAGDDHRSAGADGVRARRPLPVAAPPTVQRTPTARPSSTRTRCACDPGAQARPGGDGAGQVADVHAALGVDLAAEGAGAALDAACRRCGRSGAPLTPSACAPSIASCPLRPIRSGSSGVTRRNSSASPNSASRSRAQSTP